MSRLPCRAKPCGNCPWRLDTQPGEFAPERFAELSCAAYDLSFHLFSCHKSRDGADVVCAGFLERGADHNLAVRLAYSAGHLERLDRSGGHELHPNYRAMAIANGVDPEDHRLIPCRD